jgi:hypothetical protein
LRKEVVMAAASPDRAPALKVLAYALGALLLAAHAVAALSPETLGGLSEFRSASPLFLGGGAAVLLLALPLALKWEQVAGAALWIGSALVAAALSMEAGPRFQWFAIGFFLWALPEALAGTFFLLHARFAAPKKKRMRPRIPQG